MAHYQRVAASKSHHDTAMPAPKDRLVNNSRLTPTPVLGRSQQGLGQEPVPALETLSNPQPPMHAPWPYLYPPHPGYAYYLNQFGYGYPPFPSWNEYPYVSNYPSSHAMANPIPPVVITPAATNPMVSMTCTSSYKPNSVNELGFNSATKSPCGKPYSCYSCYSSSSKPDRVHDSGFNSTTQSYFSKHGVHNTKVIVFRGPWSSVSDYSSAADKTPNRLRLNLLNFTKVALQTGKDSLRGLLLVSQVPRARGESQIRLQRVKGAERLPLPCPTVLIHLHQLYRTQLI